MGEGAGGADAEAGVGVAHLLTEAVEERAGMGGNAGFGDDVVGSAVFFDVGLNGFGEEPIEEIAERHVQLLGDFRNGGVSFEDFRERVGRERLHRGSPVEGV